MKSDSLMEIKPLKAHNSDEKDKELDDNPFEESKLPDVKVVDVEDGIDNFDIDI